VTEEFSSKYRENLTAYFSIADLVASLESPRKIMIMVKAGSPVDAVIADLIPLLDA
jgi:6-phosphogluconate dehydrogenase